MCCHLHAVEAGHAYVEQQDIRLQLCYLSERRIAVSGFAANLVTRQVIGQPPEAPTGKGFIVNDQNLLFCHGCCVVFGSLKVTV